MSTNNESVFKDLYLQYKPLVAFVAATYLTNKNYVDDIIQDVFIEFFNHLNEIKDYKNYLITLAKNKSLNLEHKNNKNNLYEDMDLFLSESVKENIITNELFNNLSEFLSRREIDVIFLRIYGDFSFKDIGAKLNIDEKNIKNIYYRALKKCRKEFL